jgi:hypothetical protein
MFCAFMRILPTNRGLAVPMQLSAFNITNSFYVHEDLCDRTTPASGILWLTADFSPKLFWLAKNN